MSGKKFGVPIPSGKVPLCERDASELTEEEKAKLVTVEQLVARGIGNLSDSIWAPGNEKILVAKRLQSQELGPRGWIPKKDMVGIGPSGFGPLTKPLASSTKPSFSGAVATFTPNNGGVQDISSLPPHLRPVGPKPISNVPPHLRGIGRHVPPSRPSAVVTSTLNADENNTTSVPPSVAGQRLDFLPTNVSDRSLSQVEEHKIVTNAPPESIPQSPQTVDPFQAFITKKAASDLLAKKKSLARKAFQPPPTIFVDDTTAALDPPLNWTTPESKQIIGGGFHSHFTSTRPDEVVDTFQTFLKEKDKQEVVGGKRYNHATQPVEENVFAAPTKFAALDPHAVFSPSAPHSKEGEVSKVFVFGKVANTPDSKDSKAEVSPTTTRHLAVLLEQAKSSIGQVEEDDGRWTVPTLEHFSARGINHIIAQEIKASILPTTPLTKGAILQGCGSAPREDYAYSFECHISDTGVEGPLKENVRRTQGIAASEELLDWDKSWLPAPCDWEGRRTFDTGFMKEYIAKDWEPKVPQALVRFPLDHPDFYYGWCPVNNLTLDAPVQHQDTIADTQNSENEEKRLLQTAQIELVSYTRKLKRHMKKAIVYEEIEPQTFVPPPNPFAPKIDIYLRPATLKDAPGICAIYNHYVVKSFVTEDHTPVAETDIKMLIETCRKEEFPFIVAVQGNMPAGQEPRVKNKIYGAAKATPAAQVESDTVLGFAFAQAFSYGISGVRTGRSRTTADVQFYVDKEFTRQGVGRCLLDKITQCLSFGYAAKEGYAWLNAGDNKVYKSGGVHYIHQLIIQLTVPSKNDLNVTWLTAFFMKYWYMDEGKIERIGRSSAEHFATPEFLDVVFFCNEAMAASEFNAMV